MEFITLPLQLASSCCHHINQLATAISFYRGSGRLDIDRGSGRLEFYRGSGRLEFYRGSGRLDAVSADWVSA